MNFINKRILICISALFFSGVIIAQNRIVINTDLGKETIDRHIYGHFSEHLGGCIYGGYWVGEKSAIPNTNGIRNDVVAALKEIAIPNLRWPGGCFADEYHWKDGIGPREKRPAMINTFWGEVTENNHFGTHEFLELCRQLECEPVICGNLGSGAVQEMSQWVEYLNSGNVSPLTDLRKSNGRNEPWGVKYWDLGNESWGCGGKMTPEYYVNEMRRYSAYVKNYGNNKLYKVACGPHGADYHWMETLMRDSKGMFDGISLHYYTNNRGGSATEFTEKDYFKTFQKALFMNELLQKHIAIMDKYDPNNRIGLIVDEWGTWHDVAPGTNPNFLYQQSTLRDALVASVNLDLFNNYCRRVKMANIAQTVNVLQAMILTKDKEIVKTPSWYVFRMYKVHHDATLLPVHVQVENYTSENESIPAVSVSSSKTKDGRIHITLSNLNPNKQISLTCELRGLEKATFVKGEIISAEKVNSFNDFGKPEGVKSSAFSDVKINGNLVNVDLPSKSIVMIGFK
jgi:alpha-N-arabinofuranosidase